MTAVWLTGLGKHRKLFTWQLYAGNGFKYDGVKMF